MAKEKTPVKASKKDVKKLTSKKLPSLFKKNYSEKAFEKKILNKIYIPEDKALVKEMFKKGADAKKPEFYAVPAEYSFSKKELKRYKTLAKEIKGNKGRIKFLPLIATVCFVFAVVIVGGIFKNQIAKSVIKSTCQSIFSAKTDIASVDLKILDASITINGLAIGNKDDVMKNLFEAEKIALDFNLPQALRGKFDAENLEVTGIALGTERNSSCELPKKVKQEKKENEKKAEESAFMQSLRQKSEEELSALKSGITEILGGDDVDSIVENIRSQLKTFSAADQAEESITSLVAKWQSKPSQLEKQVSDFSKSVQDLQSIDINSIKDVTSLKSTLEKINSAISTGSALKDTTSSLTTELKADSESLKSNVKTVTDAVKADKALAEEKLTTVTNLAKNAKSVFTNAIDTVGYGVLGKYYPYAKKIVDKALELKSNADANKKVLSEEENQSKKASKKTKKEGSRRLAGTTFWYTKENPAFLIEHVKASGETFSAEGFELTNDQNVRGKPMTLNGSFAAGESTHKGEAVLDIRSESAEPLIKVDYTLSGFNAFVDGSQIASFSGVPNIDGKAKLTLKGSVGDGMFSAYGNVSLSPLSLSSDGFESETLTKYYNEALSGISSLSFGYNLDYTEFSGVALDLNGNFADVFVNALQKLALSVGSDAKNEALKKIQEELNFSSGEVNQKAKEFFGIEEEINLQNTKLSDVQKQLEAKKAEIEAQIKKQTEDAAKSAVSSAVKNVTGSSEASSKATEAASSLLKGLKK